MTHAARADNRSPRRRWGRPLLAGVVVLWAVIVVLVVAIVLSPTLPTTWAWAVSLLATSYSLYMTATEVFATVDGQPLRLDVRRPERPRAGGPAIVYVHGGGWTMGGRNEVTQRLQWFVDSWTAQVGYGVLDQFLSTYTR
ncbi:hypothetical protein [Nocardia sp. NPDC052566]|uniref:hypothetical protein n=1 Tax=Nocardia sp. NPDC052566 TaxID=3364330 RepID=UPI0037C97079